MSNTDNKDLLTFETNKKENKKSIFYPDNKSNLEILSTINNDVYKNFLETVKNTRNWEYVNSITETTLVMLMDRKCDGVRYPMYKKLSNRNRIKISREIGLLESIEILCFDKLNDIKYVKLFLHVPVPKDPIIKQKVENNEPLNDEEKNWIYDHTQFKSTYQCIKTINPSDDFVKHKQIVSTYQSIKPINFTDNFVIKFSELPIPICALPYTELSIEVSYNDKCISGFRSENVLNFIKFNCMVLNNRKIKELICLNSNDKLVDVTL